MKNYDDIISSFDSIPELPISEEMLGAYIEGNLEGDELIDVGYSVQEDGLLNTLANEIYTDDFIRFDMLNIDAEEIPNLPEIIDFVPFDNTNELQYEFEEAYAQTNDLFDCSDEEFSFEDNIRLNETQLDDANENFEFNDDSLEESSLNDM